MNKLIKIIFVLFFLLPLCMQAQMVTWQREYLDSTSSFTDGYAAVQLEDEGFIIVSGRSFSSLGIVAMRLDKFGNLIWRRYYSGTNPRTIVKTQDGRFLIGANSLTKIDVNGDIVWSRTVPAYNINLTPDGGFYYCAGYTHPFLRKYDSLGFLIWEKTYDNVYRGGFNNCLIKRNMEIVLIGNYSPGSLLLDYPFIMKTDSLGKVIWIEKYEYDSLKYFYLNNINETENGEFITSGSNWKCYIVKFNNIGNWLWIKYFDFPGTLTSLEPTRDHGYAFGGYLKVNDTTDRARLIKTDQDGNLQWMKLYGFGHYASSNCVIQTSDDGFLLAGRRDTFQYANVIVIKTDVNGNTSPWLNINSISETVPQDFTLYQNSPNPFNPNTKIYFDIRNKSYAELTIHNSLGQKITVLISQDLNPGKYSVDFNINNFGNLLPSGIYFYTLRTDNFSASRKMLILK